MSAKAKNVLVGVAAFVGGVLANEAARPARRPAPLAGGEVRAVTVTTLRKQEPGKVAPDHVATQTYEVVRTIPGSGPVVEGDVTVLFTLDAAGGGVVLVARPTPGGGG